MGGGMLFQILVALYLKLLQKAAVLCRGTMSGGTHIRNLLFCLGVRHFNLLYRYKGDLDLITLNKRDAI